MDKPVKTRVHELLGVEPGERFYVKGSNMKSAYYLAEGGTLWCEDDYIRAVASSFYLAKFLSGEWTILRCPFLAGEQRKVLEALKTLGFKWVAIDKNGRICAYVCKPAIVGSEWACVNESVGKYGAAVTGALDCLRPLIPDWAVPLDVEKTLKEAQNGV